MFDQIFKVPAIIARHVRAPYAEERARYLKHLAEQGVSHFTLRERTVELLWIARKLKRSYGRLDITERQLEKLMSEWRAHFGTGKPKRPAGMPCTRHQTLGTAPEWLHFLGVLPVEPIPFQDQFDAYCRWAREERGLSECTIDSRRYFITGFLRHYGPAQRPLSGVKIHDIDAYLAHGAARWKRVTRSDAAKALRAFFRYGVDEGFSPAHLPALIRGPRLYAQEGLPRGPQWPDVQRLLASLDPKRPKDIRDRVILMLFAFYGLRRSEVARLTLDDIDWERDLLHVSRAKRGGRQTYPLSASLGNALLQYLKTVRPTSSERALLFAFTYPPRPVSVHTLYAPVAHRLKALDVKVPHRGPHCLRHALATHLLAEGVTMKVICDQLGHHSVNATRTYAKVDLTQLRKVAAFDLGALS